MHKLIKLVRERTTCTQQLALPTHSATRPLKVSPCHPSVHSGCPSATLGFTGILITVGTVKHLRFDMLPTRLIDLKGLKDSTLALWERVCSSVALASEEPELDEDEDELDSASSSAPVDAPSWESLSSSDLAKHEPVAKERAVPLPKATLANPGQRRALENM